MKLERLVKRLVRKGEDVKKTFAERFTNWNGLIPAEQIAEILEEPSLIKEIKRYRKTRVALDTGKEILAGLSTYALFSVASHPEFFISTIGASVFLNVLTKKTHEHYTFKITMYSLQKFVEVIPYHGLLQIELSNRGFGRVHRAELFRKIIQVEYKNLGMNKVFTYARPIVQSLAAIHKLPAWIIGGGLTTTYALIPWVLKKGKEDTRFQDRLEVSQECYARSQLQHVDTLREKLFSINQKYFGENLTNQIYREITNKTPDLLFVVAALLFRTSKGDVLSQDAFGFFRYLSSIFRNPREIRDLKQSTFIVERDKAFVSTMHQILSGEPYFLLKKPWETYRTEKIQRYKEKKNFAEKRLEEPGILLEEFHAEVPGKEEKRYTSPISLRCTPGEIIFLQAPSGEGKSLSFGKALCGLSRAEGGAYFRDYDGSFMALEDHTRIEIQDRVWYVAPSYGFEQYRVCDIFPNMIIDKYCEDRPPTSLEEFEALMLTMEDVELEKELCVIAKELKEEGKNRTYFGYENPRKKGLNIEGALSILPKEKFDYIHTFRMERKSTIEVYLKSRGSNFQYLKGDQSIGNLSTGMKTRLMFEEYHQKQKSQEDKKTKAIIFDEPFGPLDPKNTKEYLVLIKEFSEQKDAPVIIIISHTHQKQIYQELGDKIRHYAFSERTKTYEYNE